MTEFSPSLRRFRRPLALLVLGLLLPVGAGAQEPASSEAAGSRILPDLEQQRLQALANSQGENTRVIWLETNQESFLGLYEPALQPRPKGGILLLHHDRTSADWPGPIKSLRQGLPEEGWHTLSIAVPDQPRLPVEQTLAAEARGEEGKLLDRHFEQISERIESGLSYLQTQGAEHFMVLGVGSGAYWAMRYTREVPERVNSLVLIDALRPHPTVEPELDQLVGELQVPILDLFHGSMSGREPVELRAAQRGREVRRKGLENYLQYRISHRPSDWKRADQRLISIMRGLIAKRIDPLDQRKKVEKIGRPPTQQRPPGS